MKMKITDRHSHLVTQFSSSTAIIPVNNMRKIRLLSKNEMYKGLLPVLSCALFPSCSFNLVLFGSAMTLLVLFSQHSAISALGILVLLTFLCDIFRSLHFCHCM